ncbi:MULTISPECIES: hypothetical protein [Enterobacteriaceae]|jgi:hypothetical protein|uniref:Nicotinate-nucleotide adenylyltransferase n=10 Tax=Enterobacterales TaxID=91347 RepID=E3PYT6_ECOLX|nr:MULTISPECIES: hypothetical protein [Enterobacteriaceae]EID1687437.1 hypothetical protein [Salmonella enterica subsp. enterica serovar Infantis]EKL3489002.1 hypothetical protein [Salmonella enterica]AIF77722.1 Nicotinate-nucleotide adenylyltransferase [Escherichia coli]ATX45224.1 hypothetical protein AM333_27030 [Escherichia coli]EFD4402635.1 hypothetical protein [Escherichia coli]
MLKKILDSISYQTDKFIRENIHVNQSYMALKWNGFEKILVSGSKHYVKAMLILISFFAAIFIVMVSGKSYIKPYIAEWFPDWYTLFDAQINLLGGQLTIIGIVYPMVVGLVSVIFQRKSARKIVHAAYQTYSGFMLAGLSGLCLSGFMLCGLLLRTFVGNYNYAIICGISIIWMMLNIALSVWFFVQSLSVLDDEKRERMVLRFLTTDILSAHVKSQLHSSFLNNPVKSQIIKNERYSNLTFEDYSFENDYSVIKSEISIQEVIKDIYVRPLKIILWLVNMHGRLKKKQIAIALFSRLDSRSEFDTLPLFKVKNIESEHVLITLLTRCFRTGIATQRHIATDRIIKGLLGDAIDALASADINAFDEAIEGFCRDITTFTDGFNFRQGQQTDNLLLLADDIFLDRSFTDKLYTELYQLFRQAVIRIDVSERFYTKCMNIPGMLCSKRESISFKEIQLALMYTFYSWDILVRWGHANTGRLDLTQRQSYEALLRNFVEIWEGWTDGLKYISKKTGGQQLYHDTLKEHLFTLPDIVACAVLSGESGSVDWAVDLMNRWLHTARRSADSHNTALFSWQEFIVTQATLDGEIVFSPENTPLRKPVEFSQLQDSFYKNTLTDLRLLTAAFIISKPDAVQNKECQFAVSTLLDGSLVENTGGFERLSDSMATSTDIIDVFIRLLTWDKSERRDATNSPGNIIRKLSSAHGKSLVSGRTYMGRRLGGIEDLIPQIAELSVLRCGDTSSVSHKMKAIVASNVLSYQLLQNIVGNLSSLHNAINKLTGAAFVAENIFNERRQKVSELIQEYQDLFTNQIEQEIINSPVSSTILGNFGSVVSEFFNKSLNKNMLFSLFGNITPAPVENSNIMGRIFFSMDKQDVTDNFSRKIHGFEENCAYALINEHVLDLLDLLSRQPAQRYIDVTSFTELMSVVHDYDDLQEGDYLIVGDERLWDQFNEYRANTIDSVEGKEDILFYDEDRKVQIRGKEKSCSLYIRPHFDAIDAVLVNKNYFEEYKIKSEGENIFTFNAEEVDGKPLEIALHSQYEGEAVFSGQIKIRFTLRNDSVSSQALPGEDAS